MENREIFSTITALPPVFLRLDGRAFHHLSDVLGLERPFDDFFHKAMVTACTALVADSGLNPDLAYTFSDEISLYFTKLPFSGRVEKLDSVAASYAASSFTLALGSTTLVAFDARVIPATPEYAKEYLVNRQAEAWRNHINAYCQQALIEEGLDPRKAQEQLTGLPAKALHEMMHERGFNLATTPAWQRRGTLVYKKLTEKEGFNPITRETVITERSTVVAESDLPLFSSPEGQAFLAAIVK
ncbi:tRNA(His) guanylyltransferase Thg1 family protein [Methanoregula sp.]|uniref:tRNA(His) guanylyltransferase Thg1 family protein n=1 Tax=Methanoregula sp. TaxID=2052170 RepID=UPI0026076BD8|nr:tRNA(His) guanylyltransferase Thg1 family protein [Methanoregula sp.]MDD5143306.1 tRNA(His) guanylyltransferase Thg1 family protein [Methanoregula sp.]